MGAVAEAEADAVAVGVLELWRHAHGLQGGAPGEGLLQLLALTMAKAVTSGGWGRVLGGREGGGGRMWAEGLKGF